MKNLIKYSLFLFVLFLSSVLDAAENRYDFYRCNSRSESMECTNCKSTDTQAVFKVQSVNNVVIRTVYKNGKFHSSTALENCKVVDEKNWICESEYFLDAMNNGMFSSVYVSLKNPIFTCGKKQKFFNIF